jgi:hypothetical protein
MTLASHMHGEPDMNRDIWLILNQGGKVPRYKPFLRFSSRNMRFTW